MLRFVIEDGYLLLFLLCIVFVLRFIIKDAYLLLFCYVYCIRMAI